MYKWKIAYLDNFGERNPKETSGSATRLFSGSVGQRIIE